MKNDEKDVDRWNSFSTKEKEFLLKILGDKFKELDNSGAIPFISTEKQNEEDNTKIFIEKMIDDIKNSK